MVCFLITLNWLEPNHPRQAQLVKYTNGKFSFLTKVLIIISKFSLSNKLIKSNPTLHSILTAQTTISLLMVKLSKNTFNFRFLPLSPPLSLSLYLPPSLSFSLSLFQDAHTREQISLTRGGNGITEVYILFKL